MATFDPDAIYLEQLCGNRSIYDAFWSYQLTVNTSQPRLTQCFTYTAMIWVPQGYLLISLLFYIPYVLQYPVIHRVGSISQLNLAKMVLGSFMILISAVSLGDVVARYVSAEIDERPHLASGIGIFIQVLGLVVAEVVTYWIYRRGLHTSGVLFIYWLLLLITSILWVITDVMEGSEHPNRVTDLSYRPSYIFLVTVSLQFFLTIPADKAAMQKSLNQQEVVTDDVIATKSTPTYTYKAQKPCPKNSASFLSVVFYTWFSRMVLTGHERTLQYSDIWDIRDQDSSKTNLSKFIKDWEAELIKNGYPRDERGGVRIGDKKYGRPSLWRVLWRSVGKSYMSAGAILLVCNFLELVNPQILNGLICFMEGHDPFVWHGYLMACAMFLVSMITAVMLHNGLDLCYNVGMRLRTITTGAIYRKAMKLSSCGQTGKKSAGEITNMMSVDAQRMQDTLLPANQLWISPLVICTGTYLLWQEVGVASLAGVAVYLFLVPGVTLFTSKFIKSLQVSQMKLKDSRIKLMNQILNGVKVLKLYTWEKYFEDRIQQIREEEVTYMKRGSLISTINTTVSKSAAYLASLLMFLIYVLAIGDGVLPPDVTFVSLALIGSLSTSITVVPMAIMQLIQGSVSVRRIQDFLLAEELDPSGVSHGDSEDDAVVIKDGTFTWGADRIILEDINIVVPEGMLVAIVGHVGSGKSSLISSMLGETLTISGTVNVSGSVAYVPQQAWIQNLTLRDNILFTKPYERTKYNELLHACALTEDLKVLAGGDLTEIGEKGINLSGGQKQRVSLARAVYQNNDIYLMDDPLSAVDAHVGKHIFDNVIGPNGWLRNKTRALVTNAVTLLPKVDLIFVLKEGCVTEQGTYDDLIEHQGPFSEFVATYLREAEMDPEDDALIGLSQSQSSRRLHEPVNDEANMENTQEAVDDEKSTARLQVPGSTGKSSHEWEASGSCTRLDQRRRSSADKGLSMLRAMEEDEQKKANTLIIEETAEEGSIKLAVLNRYIRATGWSWSLVVLTGVIMMVGGTVSSNIWLADWSNDSILDAEAAAKMVSLRLGIYGTLGAVTVTGITMVAIGVIFGTVGAATRMHNNMLDNILKSPMSFFDTVPLGRLINRFSKDIDTMDTHLRFCIQFWILQFTPIIATLIIISYSTPLFIAVVIPLAILFGFLQVVVASIVVVVALASVTIIAATKVKVLAVVLRFYVKTVRQIKRIDSVKRSPIYNNFSETLSGLTTIRAYNQQARFIKHADVLLDNNQKVWFAVYSSNRWISVISQNLGNLVVFFTAIFCVAGHDTMDAGTAGMSLTFALQIGMQIVLALRTTCELESYIVSAERVAEYTETPQEAPWHLEGRTPAADWPTDGTVKFEDYCMRHREGLDIVLKGINCSIRPQEKVGIVGRTGAGKSSMTMALFRIVEAASGAIYVDDVNIATMGLHDMRSKLTIIPQDPVVFSGTLRFNVDPAEAFTEAEVWKALEQAHLKPFIETLQEGLDYECGEEGNNLSVGQRQLVCLARALLRRTKILILDEATAAVDLETDDLIQETIRTAFKDCTVITIAHRLNTIMDTDRVVVLDKGQVKEFDTPQNLLENEESLFYRMAKDAGII